MANDFTSNPWVIDTVEEPLPTRRRGRAAVEPLQGKKPPMSADLLRVSRIRYVGGTVGEEILIQDQNGKVVWEGRVRTEPISDTINAAGVPGTNWDGFNVVKLGTGTLYVELL